MTKLCRFVLGWAMVLCAMLALACAWDSDTLSFETKKFPDISDAIVGRFERNPPKYYEMRIERLLPRVNSGTATLNDLDDVAVAYDRLGKGEEAIKMMALKAQLLKAKPDKEHQYRYYANLGTFQAHLWVRTGASKEKLALMEAGRDHIAAAIKLNSNAHFGREATQLKMINGLIAQAKGDKEHNIYLALYEDSEVNSPHIKGLQGLVVLGVAWESPDTYALLAPLLSMHGEGQLAKLALFRAQELIDGGKKPQFDVNLKELPGMAPQEESLPALKRQYLQLRENADEFDAHRRAFMEKQFALGKHPDTDPNFWDGYEEIPPLVLPDTSKSNSAMSYLWTAVYCLPALIGVWLIVRILRKPKVAA